MFWAQKLTSKQEQFYKRCISELEAQLRQRDERIAFLEKQVAELLKVNAELAEKVAKLSRNSWGAECRCCSQPSLQYNIAFQRCSGGTLWTTPAAYSYRAGFEYWRVRLERQGYKILDMGLLYLGNQLFLHCQIAILSGAQRHSRRNLQQHNSQRFLQCLYQICQ